MNVLYKGKKGNTPESPLLYFKCTVHEHHIYSTLFKTQERKSGRRSKEIEQRKESQNKHTHTKQTHTHKTRTYDLNLLH